jgi:hypothetical protein
MRDHWGRVDYDPDGHAALIGTIKSGQNIVYSWGEPDDVNGKFRVAVILAAGDYQVAPDGKKYAFNIEAPAGALKDLRWGTYNVPVLPDVQPSFITRVGSDTDAELVGEWELK